MTRQWHRLLQILIGYPQPYDDHVDNIATTFFCRGLAQNVTMVGFLGASRMHGCYSRLRSGWLTILHFGPNSRELTTRPRLRKLTPDIYPFFRFSPSPEDPYTFPLTFTASSLIWVSHVRGGMSELAHVGGTLNRRHLSSSARSSPGR